MGVIIINDRLLAGEEVLIDCDVKIWQIFTLQAILELHFENHTGTFRVRPPIGDQSNPIDYSNWYALVANGVEGKTDHVIKSPDVWEKVCNILDNNSIEYRSLDPDTHVWSQRTVEVSVSKYLQYLAEKGYLVDLNMHMSYLDEYSYKLSDVFFNTF